MDPVFAGLFRPDDDGPVDSPPEVHQPEPPESPAPGDVAADEPAAPSPGPLLPLSEPAVDTGRLFRSQGVVDNTAAVLALSSDHSKRLRTLERLDDPLADRAASIEEGPDAILLEYVAAVPAVALTHEPAGMKGGHRPSERAERRARRHQDRESGRLSRSISAGAVYLIIIGVTVLVAFAEAMLSQGDLGWITGLALAVSTAYCALTVRRADDSVAIITPPIAYLVAALTAGQLFLGSAEGSLVNRAVVVFFSLADNWYWIVGSTLAAVVIVIIRRRRA